MSLPYHCETRDEANRIFGHIDGLKWKFVPASYGRTGINTMFNHGPEWRLLGTLDVCIARVPVNIEIIFDGVNIGGRLKPCGD